MRIRDFTLFVVVALVAAACSPSTTADSTTTTLGPETTTTVAAPAVPEPVSLTYSLQAGDHYTFDVDLDQTIDMTATGDPSALGEDEIPGAMSIRVAGTTSFDYSVADGPEPGTYEVTIKGDFSDLEFTGTIDGQPVDSSDIPEFANMEPIDATVVVDEQGNVIPDESGLDEDFMGSLGGLEALGQLGSSGNAGQFIGPPFTEDEVTVGDTWSETVETPTLPGDDPITTQIDSEVVATDTIEGHEVFVIDTVTTTSAFEFDLGEILIGFMLAFAPEGATDEEQAQLDAIADQLKFAFSVDDTVSNLTTWFDYEAGLARRADYANTTHMVMDINLPDETTNELIAFGMDMTIHQDVSYRLSDAGSA